jgi:SAM-dependent methyltransferase
MAREKERWTSGSAYEAYVGRWSRLVAAAFVDWLDTSSRARWLDVGCGTGALTRIILANADPAAVIGVDQSVDFVAFNQDGGAVSAAALVAGDAIALPIAATSIDVAVSSLVLNFVPDPARMVGEMVRVTRPGGTVALCVWDYAGEMQMMRHFWDAAAELDSAARELDEGLRFTVCNLDRLKALFEDAGLAAVRTRTIDIATHFQDFDDFWFPFLGGTGTAPTYTMSLSEEQRSNLRENLRSRLPVETDGGIRLIARALAVSGTR